MNVQVTRFATCKICFEDMIQHSNFVPVMEDVLMDQIGIEYMVYFLLKGEDVQCEQECHDDVVAGLTA